MIIVIDGPDGAGKTTLAKWIAEKYNLEYYRTGNPAEKAGGAVEYFERLILDFIVRKLDVVLDRGIMGELVYPVIFQRPTAVTETSAKVLTMEIEREGGTTIICLPDVAVCQENWSVNYENEMLKLNSQLVDSWHLFNCLSDHFDLGLYDYTTDSRERLLDDTMKDRELFN